MTDPAAQFDLAVRLFHENRLAEAEGVCRQMLNSAPPHPRQSHVNLLSGMVRQRCGDWPAAETFFRQALALDPKSADPMFSWAMSLLTTGQRDEGIGVLRLIVEHRGDFAEARQNLGAALVESGAYDEAITQLREAARLRPELAQTHYNLGNALWKLERLAEAAASFREAIRLQPDFLSPRGHLGAVLQAQGDLEGAAATYREALAIDPNYTTALVNYGKTLYDLDRLDEALVQYDRVLALDPNSTIAWFNRGNLFARLEDTARAVADYERAIALQPNYSQAHNNLVLLHFKLRQFDDVLAVCQRAFAAGVHTASLHATLGNTLRAVGQGRAAIEEFRRSLALTPDPVQHSNLVYALNFIGDADPADVFAEHLEWACQFAEPLTAQAAPHANDRPTNRRPRIGYVSAHFREHAVNFFAEPLVASHDAREFEIFCYASVLAPDAATARLRSIVEHWRDIAHLSDAEVAQLVRDDQIDILVDLTGHIGENRLLVFARKPAPIQVTYIGYQNTTGMSAMDYRLTDERADPPGSNDQYYTEKLIRLPRAFFCYRPSDDSPPVTPLPALTSGQISFGAFNNLGKLTDESLAAWLAILARVPQSRLLLLADHCEAFQRHLIATAHAASVDPARIVFCDKRPRRDYLALISQADIALDSFPFNGHTTTCDCVWMGVPVIMLEGSTYATRFGASVLANLDLESLIAHSTGEYVDTAVRLASDLPALAQLRADLRTRMATSVLCDFTGFGRDVQAAYRAMWAQSTRGILPRENQ